MGRLSLLLANLDSRLQRIFIAVTVGFCAGMAAVGLNYGLHRLPRDLESLNGALLRFLFPAMGIFCTVIFLRYVARDSGGHGVPEAIHAVSVKGGLIKFRASFSKLIGSLITISSGGSAGPEAPVIISGSAIGSNIARAFKANEMVRISVVGAGAAAAIAAIFNAPITGIIFTLEVILGEWSAATMLPVAIASVTGTVVSRFFNGNQIPFDHRPLDITIPDILASALLALWIAALTVMFLKSLKFTGRLFARISSSLLLRALIGGILVSVVVWFFPVVRGEGYGLVRSLIGETYSVDLLILPVLLMMKMAATSLTLGAGGAGGVFAPSLVIGSLGGWGFYRLLSFFLPTVPFSGSGLFALVGMAGMISGTMQAPLTGIFLIVEITGGYDAILPLLMVSFLTPLMVRRAESHSIYHQELVQGGTLLRMRTDGRVLSELKVVELLEEDVIRIRPQMRLRDLSAKIAQSRRNYFPVENPDSEEYLGMVVLDDIKSLLFTPELLETVLVEEVMRTDIPVVDLQDNVQAILRIFDETGSWSLPVLSDKKFVGLISKATILDQYRRELKAQTEMD